LTWPTCAKVVDLAPITEADALDAAGKDLFNASIQAASTYDWLRHTRQMVASGTLRRVS